MAAADDHSLDSAGLLSLDGMPIVPDEEDVAAAATTFEIEVEKFLSVESWNQSHGIDLV